MDRFALNRTKYPDRNRKMQQHVWQPEALSELSAGVVVVVDVIVGVVVAVVVVIVIVVVVAVVVGVAVALPHVFFVCDRLKLFIFVCSCGVFTLSSCVGFIVNFKNVFFLSRQTQDVLV